ncbi:hypothetical protein niasHT_019801 [Heterodera trifolii]|uniref:Phosphatidic acid phosphatase type 2/haloperoxidase domain-containing protein n=1 Tax=Heterodera trifolii TaxID=157864 RepID=A0ABD2LD53_9BILA
MDPLPNDETMHNRPTSVVLPPPIYEDFEANGSGATAQQRTRAFRLVQIMANFGILFFVGFVAEQFFKWVGPYQRGFFCDDDSIRLPYKSSTVPDWLLLVYALGVPPFVFAFGEFICLSRAPALAIRQRLNDFEFGEGDRLRFFCRFAYFYGNYLIAFVANFTFTLVAKFSVGRLRPHFVDLCKPNVVDFCATPTNWHTYIEHFECDKNVLQDQIDSARLSFFSGHSSLAMCASVFIAIYLHVRLSPLFRARLFVLVPLLQIAFLSLGMLIAYSRIKDHMHHSTDVLIGIVAGTSVATFTALFIARLNINGTDEEYAVNNLNTSKNGGKPSAATVTERL